ncbi:hypothetical protein [Saccharopolyspora thermophila]|uniref:Uncharacterized protein n=1 Tax=Saccharopolyspora thermophila TaxID=89367 RepID=A0ABN1DBM7_9PSEU
MPHPAGLPWPNEFLTGVPMPLGKPKRMLIADRTGIEVTVWPEFNTADLLIDSLTPVVYTLGRRNLLRLNECVSSAVAQFTGSEGR